MRVPNSSPILDKNLAPMGPGFVSNIGAGVRRKAPWVFLDSTSANWAKRSIAFWGVIAFLQHAPEKSSASKMEGFPQKFQRNRPNRRRTTCREHAC